MPKETKKEHFVPETYLLFWTEPNSKLVYAYDKQEKKTFKPNVNDIAQQRYFYDVDFTGLISEDKLKELGLENCDPKYLDDGQYLEKLFRVVEGDLSKSLKEIINRVNGMSTEERKHNLFLSDEEKINMSHHLALQYIRVKACRTSILDSADCLSQVMHDMGIPQEAIDKHSIKKLNIPFIHANMILNQDYLEEMAKCFYTLSWVLRISHSKQPFYTSDNPIGTVAYLEHPILSMAGLTSRGVEAYYPIAPNMMLHMFDADYHTFMKGNDGRIIEISDIRDVNTINLRSVFNSDRFVYSQTDDFSIIDELLKARPDALDQPKSTINWGGKTYKPSRYQSN